MIADRCADGGVAEFEREHRARRPSADVEVHRSGHVVDRRSGTLALRPFGRGPTDRRIQARDRHGVRGYSSSRPADVAWEFGSRSFRDERGSGRERASGTDGFHPLRMLARKRPSAFDDVAWLIVAKARVTIRDAVPPTVDGPPTGAAVSGDALEGIADRETRVLRRRRGRPISDRCASTARIDRCSDWATKAASSRTSVKRRARPQAASCCNWTPTSCLPSSHEIEAMLTDVAGNRSIVGPFVVSVRTPAPTPIAATPSGVPPVARGVVTLTGRRTLRAQLQQAPL